MTGIVTNKTQNPTQNNPVGAKKNPPAPDRFLLLCKNTFYNNAIQNSFTIVPPKN